MSIRWWILIALLGYFPCAWAEGTSPVVISEVMWVGSDLSTADEWVELAGLGDPQTLSGWTLTRLKDGEEELIMRFGEELRIRAGEFLVVSNYSANESRLLNMPALSMPAMVLPNTKLLLRLWDSEGRLIDSIDDGVGDPFAGSNTDPKSSMERISLTESGGLKSNWQTATSSLGFDEGGDLFGTPGYPNVITENEQNNDTEIQIESFSKLKITELLSDPVGSDSDGEWIEVANIGSGALNIGGLFLHIEEGGTFVLPQVQIGSGEYLVFERPVTGLSLRNAGDIVRLLHGETIIDSIEYPELPEGVSYGRVGESLQPFCVPTKGALNQVIFPEPSIVIQSGQTHAPGKVTINLEATVASGSLASATCSWDYADGYMSSSCNPPSHTFREIGMYDIHLSLTDYCVNTVERMLEIEVLETGVYEEPSYNIDEERTSCTPSVSTGILITDFVPNPEGKDKGGDPTSLSSSCEGELCPSTELRVDDGVGEWIELKNTNPNPVSLCGWVLDDIEGGSKSFGLDLYTIEPSSLLRLSIQDTKIALNNDGDSVRLFFNNTLMQEITYGEIPEGKSYKEYLNSWEDQISPLPAGEGQGEGVHKRSFTGTVIINEIYPAPLSGEEEWIEVFNPSDTLTDISGVLLDDMRGSGSKAWRAPENTIIPANGYIVFRKEQTRLALNNDGDQVNLFNGDGTLIDTVLYPKLKRGISFSRMGSRWCESEISTPLHKNNCPKNQFLSKILIEEISINKGIKSNSRSNNMINSNTLSRRERDRVRGSIEGLRTIYRYVMPKILSVPPDITSPFLAKVLSMANNPYRVISKNEARHMWEPLLLSIILFGGLWLFLEGSGVH